MTKTVVFSIAFFIFSLINFSHANESYTEKELEIFQSHEEKLLSYYKDKILEADTFSIAFTNELQVNLFVDAVIHLLDTVYGSSNFPRLNTLRQLRHFLSWDISHELAYKILYGIDHIDDLSLNEIRYLHRIEESILKSQASPELVAMYNSFGLKSYYNIDSKTLQALYPDTHNSITSVNMGFYPQDRKRLQDLFDHDYVPPGFRGGRFESVPRLFVFCRHDRRYHCLMMMKDKNGEVVRERNGRMWSMPVLALARRGKRYDEVGGYTPSGVYTIDSVMPYADQTRVFGEFRRLILNFIPRSPGEELLMSFLPESSHPYSWWRESVIGRDIGRNLLRIHGAGFKNYNIFSRHYPFVKTIGCIGTREGRYGRTTYRDQRVLLDTMMTASGLEPRYENETKLFGLLYLVEINNIRDHVSLDEMIWYLQRS